MQYRREVDGLRAIAVTSVILYHANIPPISGGYIGVDIFFVISGFLISAIIMGEIDGGRFTFAGFYERRIRRIFPALLTVILTASIVAVALLTPGQLKNFGQSIVATTLFVSNTYFRYKSGYFSPDTENLPLIHMWSLSVEEQFYIFFPLLLILIARLDRRLRVPVVLLAFAASLAWCLYEAQVNPGNNFFPVTARAWELLAGVIVALALRAGYDRTLSTPLRSFIELAGLALMIAPMFIITRTTIFPGPAALAPVGGAALLLFAATERSIVGQLLALPPMVGIGLVSYSAYLWHQPLFAFARALSDGALPLAATLALIALTFALAWLSWRYVEQPFRARGRFSRTSLFTGFALCSLGLIGFGGALHLLRGLPQRYDAATLARAATIQPSPLRDVCHTEGLKYRHPGAACRYLGMTSRWAVLGDSHGIEIGYALAEALRPSGQGIVHLTFSGCQAALTFTSANPGCSAWQREVVDWLAQARDIPKVMLVYRANFYLFGDQTRSYPELPRDRPNFLPDLSPEAAREAYWQSFAAIVSRLRAAGKQVYIVRPVPELPYHVERYVFRPGSGVAGTTRAWHKARSAFINQRLDRLAGMPGVTLLDPASVLCDAARCHAILEGKAMYFDDNHLSMAGAERFITAMQAQGLLK